MRLIVCGGRDYQDRALSFDVLGRIAGATYVHSIVHGACGWDFDEPSSQRPELLRGADRWAHEFGLERGLVVEARAAAWKRLGRRAGPSRNVAMARAGGGLLVAFPGGRGTDGMVEISHGLGIPVVRARRGNHGLALVALHEPPHGARCVSLGTLIEMLRSYGGAP